MQKYMSVEVNMNIVENIKNKLLKILKRPDPPVGDEYMVVIDKINDVLTNENKQIRPADKNNLPGGLIYLKKNIPTIIVPDLHARCDFFANILFYKDTDNVTILEKMAKNEIQIVCVGDGFHAEARAFVRWQNAFEEFLDEYSVHKYIDEEMKESLGVMEMVMETKLAFPENFHFLKGNHENILNELGNGNYPFRKFSFEGQMVRSYIEKFYGEDFLHNYANFEKNLPVFAVGKNFLISHAEPLSFFKEKEIINYRNNADLIVGLTWTDNDAAASDSVINMLTHYIDRNIVDKSYYFGGHRPISSLYNPRALGKYIQIHNPDKYIIAYIKSDKDINLDKDIIELRQESN